MDLISRLFIFSSMKENNKFLCMFLRKQGYHFTNFVRKLSRLLVQLINEFKMNEIQRKTPQ